MKKCKILLVGGGSNAWVPNIVKDMLFTDSLKEAEYVLYDINKAASDQNKKFIDLLAKRFKVNCSITSTDDPKYAFKNADYIIITISTGGFDSMAYDLSIPEDYKIFHTVGDTSGPGGWARSLRNFGAFMDLADKTNKFCPKAFILNYSNPMIFLTDILQQTCKGPVIGLCHGLFENIHVFKELYKVKDESEIHLKYAGLNHFFWITEGKVKDIDIIKDFRKRLQKKSISDILPVSKEDPMGFKSGREVADELFRMTNYIPYFGDRHTCEYFSWFIKEKKRMKEYRIERTSIDKRRKMWKEREELLKGMIAGKNEILHYYLERSRETAADIIDAHFTGKSFIDVGNVKNQGQIANLPEGTVVETACRIDKNGVSPLNFGNLPDSIVGFVEPYAIVNNLTVKACIEKDRDLALQALRYDPVCSHLSWKQVKEMGERLLKTHDKYITF